MKNIITVIILLFPYMLFAQKKCISGNCENGFGKMTDLENQQVYEGNWKNGKKEGQGTYTDLNSTYTGNWHEDVQQGSGEEKFLFEHEGKMTVSRMYTGNFERMDHKGQGKCIMYDDFGTKIIFVMEGNFERQQLSGKGSLIFPNEGTYYSDNFKDNFNFTTGYLIKKGTQQKIPGSLVKGVFKSDDITSTEVEMGNNITHVVKDIYLSEGKYSEVFNTDMIGTLAQGYKKYFVCVNSRKFAKRYHEPIGVSYFYQLINDKNQVVSQQVKESVSNDDCGYFEILPEGKYTIQVAYDYHNVSSGGERLNAIKLEIALYSHDFIYKKYLKK